MNDSDIAFLALVKQLVAGGNSQAEIARILNDRELFRPDGTAWQQFSVSRFMRFNGIKPAHIFRAKWHSSINKNNTGFPDNEQTTSLL